MRDSIIRLSTEFLKVIVRMCGMGIHHDGWCEANINQSEVGVCKRLFLFTSKSLESWLRILLTLCHRPDPMPQKKTTCRLLKNISCPQCGKKISTETHVLQHMNQPTGRCYSFPATAGNSTEDVDRKVFDVFFSWKSWTFQVPTAKITMEMLKWHMPLVLLAALLPPA